jgi:hypothetical protein
MGIADRQLSTSQAPFVQTPKEGRPEGLVLAVADFDAEQAMSHERMLRAEKELEQE